MKNPVNIYNIRKYVGTFPINGKHADTGVFYLSDFGVELAGMVPSSPHALMIVINKSQFYCWDSSAYEVYCAMNCTNAKNN